MSHILLSRDAFRAAVFERDEEKCIMCGHDRGLDAHHIVERRLWPDGGYYVDNGATLCGTPQTGCHIEAERTILTCEEIRDAAGITIVLLPPHLYRDERYDKWGNPYLPNGQRIRGELFYDESVQKVLKPVLSEFTKYVKYPRTYHLSFSPGMTKDDRIQEHPFPEGMPCVVTEKMDGENTTWYNDYMHARSVDFKPHPSRDRVRALWAATAFNIPDDWRICGENLYARHSIAYDALEGFFQLFSIWAEGNNCLGWQETQEWAELLELPVVKSLYEGPYDSAAIKRLAEDTVKVGGEGVVVRHSGRFHYSEFRHKVAKYVRQNHVQTHGHWMRNVITPNKLK